MGLHAVCHSCRHITGGRLKNFSKHPVRYWVWTQISKLNAKHMQLAWTTLGTLMLTDLYIMLVAAAPSATCGSSTEAAHGMTDIQRHTYDVVVIGAGGSGLRAAIEARLRGKKTAIISKSLFGKAHTVMAEGGCRRGHGQRQPATTTGRSTSATPCAAASS